MKIHWEGKDPKSGEKATEKKDESQGSGMNGVGTLENTDEGHSSGWTSAKEYFQVLLERASLSKRTSHNNHLRDDVENGPMSLRSKTTDG